MSEFTDKIEKQLNIKIKSNDLKFKAFLNGISAIGYGFTEFEAKYDLLCKILLSQTQQSKLIQILNEPIEKSPITFSFSFKENYCYITARDEQGRKRSIKIKIQKG